MQCITLSRIYLLEVIFLMGEFYALQALTKLDFQNLGDVI